MLTEQELIDKGFNNRNHISGRLYLGLKNQMKLNDAGYATTGRMTFLQIKQNGYKLKKGSEGIEVIHTEPVEEQDVDEDGNVSINTSARVTKHVVFNIEQTERVSDPNQQVGNTYTGKQQNIYTDGMITQKQRLLLIRLIETRYQDERIKSGLLNRLNNLTKSEAKLAIQEMLTEAR